jgi:GNAT superfamily N-acetyltransferase
MEFSCYPNSTMTIYKNEYSISTDKDLLNVDHIHSFLSQTYWAEGIPREIVAKSIEGSMCFGVYHKENQVGFARMITDQATFAYLADVFITPTHRGKGLSKWLVETILSHPELQGLRRILLATRDAHGLYEQFGFTPLTIPERWMNIHFPNVYKKSG